MTTEGNGLGEEPGRRWLRAEVIGPMIIISSDALVFKHSLASVLEDAPTAQLHTLKRNCLRFAEMVADELERRNGVQPEGCKAGSQAPQKAGEGRLERDRKVQAQEGNKEDQSGSSAGSARPSEPGLTDARRDLIRRGDTLVRAANHKLALPENVAKGDHWKAISTPDLLRKLAEEVEEFRWCATLLDIAILRYRQFSASFRLQLVNDMIDEAGDIINVLRMICDKHEAI